MRQIEGTASGEPVGPRLADELTGRTAVDIASAIITAITTASATVLAVVIANRLSYARTYKEKLWDLKRPAYGLILSELAAIEQICNTADEYIQENQDRYFESVAEKHNAKIAKHFEAINKRIADDYLIMSEDFNALYDELMKKMAGDPFNDDTSEEHQKFTAAVRKYRPLLIALARSEMILPKRWLLFPT
jgi:hypothetical protein